MDWLYLVDLTPRIQNEAVFFVNIQVGVENESGPTEAYTNLLLLTAAGGRKTAAIKKDD